MIPLKTYSASERVIARPQTTYYYGTILNNLLSVVLPTQAWTPTVSS